MWETQPDGKNVLLFWGEKNNISLRAIRRWESRTFLGKWRWQPDAVLFILTKRPKFSSTCNQEEWTHTRTADLSQETLAPCLFSPAPVEVLMSLGAFKPSRQMMGSQITPPAPRTTSIISIYSPVNRTGGKRSKHIQLWASEQCMWKTK